MMKQVTVNIVVDDHEPEKCSLQYVVSNVWRRINEYRYGKIIRVARHRAGQCLPDMQRVWEKDLCQYYNLARRYRRAGDDNGYLR